VKLEIGDEVDNDDDVHDQIVGLEAVVGRAPSPPFTPTSPNFFSDPLINEPHGEDLAPPLVYSVNTTNDSTTTTTTPTTTAIASTSNANALPIAETNAETLDLTSDVPPLIDVASTAEQAQVTNMAHFFDATDDTVIATPSQGPQGCAGAIAEHQTAVQSPPPSTTQTPVAHQPCTPKVLSPLVVP
jgi:hypothetical protein